MPACASSLEHVESITAPDDLTVVFQLKEPFGPFIGMFESGTMPMIPKHIYEGTDYANNQMNATPIGTGPFKFEAWEKGSLHPPGEERGLLSRRQTLSR